MTKTVVEKGNENIGPYYTLVVNKNGKWSSEFGDFDRQTVEDTLVDVAIFCNFKSDQLHIIKTETDLQSEIDKAVEDLQDWLEDA